MSNPTPETPNKSGGGMGIGGIIMFAILWALFRHSCEPAHSTPITPAVLRAPATEQIITTDKGTPNKSSSNDAPMVSLATEHFQDEDVAFDYPQAWSAMEATSLSRMRDYLRSQETDLITILDNQNGPPSLLVARTRNASDFDSWYQGKEAVAEQVTSQGIELMGQHYVKYSVKLVDLPDDHKAIVGSAERDDGAAAVSYQMLVEGYEYNFDFIYPSAKSAASDETARGQIMESCRFQ